MCTYHTIPSIDFVISLFPTSKKARIIALRLESQALKDRFFAGNEL